MNGIEQTRKEWLGNCSTKTVQPIKRISAILCCIWSNISNRSSLAWRQTTVIFPLLRGIIQRCNYSWKLEGRKQVCWFLHIPNPYRTEWPPKQERWDLRTGLKASKTLNEESGLRQATSIHLLVIVAWISSRPGAAIKIHVYFLPFKL